MATIGTSWTNVASKTVTVGSASISFYLDAKYTSQSQANNTTSGFYTRLRSVVNSGSASGSGYNFTCTYCSARSGTGVWTFEDETIISSSSQTISHNSDGTKSLTLTATAKNTYWGLNTSLSGTATLPTISRLAYITSASDFNDEQSPTIEFENPLSYTVYPYLNFYDDSDNLVYQLIRNSESATSPYTWNITTAEKTALLNACYLQDSYRVQIGVDTYSGTTKLGYNSVAKTFTIINSAPTATYTVTEQNAKISAIYGSSSNYIIQNASQIKVTAVPSLPKGGQVVGVALTNYDTSDEGKSQGKVVTASPYEYTFDIGSYTGFKVAVYDKRRSTSYTFTKTLINYLPIAFNSFKVARLNPTSATMVLNAEIQYYQQTFNGTANTPTIKWKIDGDANWNTLTSSQYTIDTTNNKITITNLNLASSLAYTSSGNFILYVEDLITSFQNSYPVNKGIPTCDAGDTDFQVNGDLIIADTDGENGVNVLNAINNLVKTQSYSISVTPSTSRGSNGYGTNSVDISSLNATEILAISFTSSSNFMLWGIYSSSTSQIEYYGYRPAGTYSSSITGTMKILYK